jgi:hypothetical protein
VREDPPRYGKPFQSISLLMKNVRKRWLNGPDCASYTNSVAMEYSRDVIQEDVLYLEIETGLIGESPSANEEPSPTT